MVDKEDKHKNIAKNFSRARSLIKASVNQMLKSEFNKKIEGLGKSE